MNKHSDNNMHRGQGKRTKDKKFSGKKRQTRREFSDKSNHNLANSEQINYNQNSESPSQQQIDDSIVFGQHPVFSSLESGRGNKLFIQEDRAGSVIDDLKKLAQEKGVPVKWVPKTKLEQMSENGVHQGMVLTITPYNYLTLDELIENSLKKTENPFFVMLDGLEDPHNLGSILRTADATGVSGIIIPKHRSVGLTPVAVKASTGAVEYVPVARVTNLSQSVEQLKKHNFWIYGTDMAGQSYDKWNTSGPLTVVIGNEGKGMSAQLKKLMDGFITIPMTGHVQSLNASVAAGLLMYEVFRNRNQA